MTSRKELTHEIDRSPSGPKVAAFFDVDRTLLAGFSAAGFMKDRFANEGFSLENVAKAALGTLRFGTKQTSFRFGFAAQSEPPHLPTETIERDKGH